MAMFWVLLLLVAATVVNVIGGKAGIVGDRQATWFVTMALFAAMFAAAGYAVRSRWDGVFIDRENRISLSRFQLILWTVLLVSALFTAGLSNAMPVASPTPLKIDIPPEVWALLGLGAFSAVAAPAIKDGRRASSNDPTAAIAMAEATHQTSSDGTSGYFDGPVFVKDTPADARWIDLIRGDYQGRDHVDASKLQQLAFTALLIVIYTSTLWSAFGPDTTGVFQPVTAFPEVDGGFIALLGISHAAYLADKQLAST